MAQAGTQIAGGTQFPGQDSSPSPDRRGGNPVRRIGLFGGTFDPIHLGHLHAARVARDARALDRVVFMPAGSPPHKLARELAPAWARAEMIQRAISGESRMELCRFELDRPGPSFTIDTLRALRGVLAEPASSEIFLILGSDNLRSLASWREIREVLRLAQPLVVLRGDDPHELPGQLCAELGAELFARLQDGVLTAAAAPGASSELRLRQARGEDVSAELPPAVREFLDSHPLYRSSS